MKHADFDSWRKELLFTGNIVQDGDKSVSWPDREQRFNRYLEIVEAVSGSEGIEAFIALIDSMQSKDDYGAYQATQRALGRFPAGVAAKGLVGALSGLINRQRDWAGELLCGIANASSAESRTFLSAFRKELAKADAQAQAVIMNFVIQEEDGGWLDGRRKGVIKPRST